MSAEHTVLDLDIGNSFTKWRCGENRGNVRSPHIPNLVLSVTRVRICSVLGDRNTTRNQVFERFGVEPEFAATTIEIAGLRNCYEHVEQLGTDRWLAAVATWCVYGGPSLVVDVGTALTVDYVTADGQFLGGYIVPGLAMLRRSLNADTARIAVADIAQLTESTEPGLNTSSAVRRGTQLLLTDFVVATQARMRRSLNQPINTIACGGAVEILQRHSELQNLTLHPDLVLDGLSYALP